MNTIKVFKFTCSTVDIMLDNEHWTVCYWHGSDSNQKKICWVELHLEDGRNETKKLDTIPVKVALFQAICDFNADKFCM